MQENILSVRDLSPEGKRVIVRVDFNVPVKDGKILDDTRIRAALPTIRYLLQKKASVIVMSHLGRPKGKGYEAAYSLQPVAECLSKFLGFRVPLASDCIGDKVAQAVAELPSERVLLLENLRFHDGEEHPENHPEFAANIASFGDFYVNDAFGTSHRKHASVYVVPQFFPERSAAGFLVEKELEFLGQNLIQSPKKPFSALLGGAKVSSKIGVIEALLDKVDNLLLAGGMGYTFLKAIGKQIGNSLYEESGIPLAETILRKAKDKGVSVFLPVDAVVAKEANVDADTEVVQMDKGIPQHLEGLDIGPETLQAFTEVFSRSATIFWNGPVGVYEVKPFDKGSMEIAKYIASLQGVVSVIGGGDAGAVANLAGVSERVSLVSTGGGASLEFIEHGMLPGIEVLSRKLL
ncbi:phosphoglycerate kinase [Chlamydiifrater phoenicopteri]|uniref:phosphoglycerate kinase n=1 Tax=Chlamydiifrater phoenicopteri TaxID=2681469 RepID=UPI001BCFE69E|nr:phosphoglycerate kinase [Chlamydiifrater phoenicopteri]